MNTISIILVLLLVVVVSGIASRFLRPLGIPRPLVQIALGAVVGLSSDWRVQLDPDVFFLLFLPPLLFLDGWRIPKEELFKDKVVILELALGLVIFTVVGMGFLIHWMIPAMPLAVAFALAAVVSPTDPIAVSAIGARVPIPKRMMHILEGESLLNDASGLVCLRFAVVAALTGTFSTADAASSLLWVASCGIVVGVAVTWVVARGKDWIVRQLGEESGSQILISLLIPFAAYLAAEHLEGSGILAAVAAGITMTFAEKPDQALATTRMRRNSVWDAMQFALNGIIFVLLGEQLPVLLSDTRATLAITGHEDPLWLLAYALAITAGLGALRLAWVWLSLKFTGLRTRWRGKASERTDWRLVIATSLAGARGAITLAGVLTLPEIMTDGRPFPARDLAIVLAMGVIVLSLIVASIGLPLLLRRLDIPREEEGVDTEENRARVATAMAALEAIEEEKKNLAKSQDPELATAAAVEVTDYYRARLEVNSQPETAALARRRDALRQRLLVIAVKAERRALLRLVRRREIGGDTARRLMREYDLMEARYEA